jgi:hypothetical protein
VATAGTYRIERKWVATDACGNPKTLVQNVTVSPDDLTAPYLVTDEMEEQITVECSSPEANDLLNAPNYPLAYDACDADVIVTFNDEKILENCGSSSYIILRTWIATDDAGNTNEFQQFITLEDNTPPVIYNIPEDVDVICGNPLPPVPSNIFAIDTCAANGIHSHLDVAFIEQEFAGNACDGVGKIIRYWTAIDSCDNAITLEQTITLYPINGGKIAKNKNTFEKGIEKNKIILGKSNKLRIYPNPSSGNTYIDVPENTSNLKIINELGQIMYSVSQVAAGIHPVNMQQWENGIYIIQIQLEGKIQTQKMFLTKENK